MRFKKALKIVQDDWRRRGIVVENYDKYSFRNKKSMRKKAKYLKKEM